MHRRVLDIAYGAYGFLGAVALWIAEAAHSGSRHSEADAHDAFVAGLSSVAVSPFGVPAVVALAVACWLSIRLVRDRSLVLLFFVTLVCIVCLVVWSRFESESFPWFLVIVFHGVTCTTSGICWFLFRRWRLPRPAV